MNLSGFRRYSTISANSSFASSHPLTSLNFFRLFSGTVSLLNCFGSKLGPLDCVRVPTSTSDRSRAVRDSRQRMTAVRTSVLDHANGDVSKRESAQKLKPAMKKTKPMNALKSFFAALSGCANPAPPPMTLTCNGACTLFPTSNGTNSFFPLDRSERSPNKSGSLFLPSSNGAPCRCRVSPHRKIFQSIRSHERRHVRHHRHRSARVLSRLKSRHQIFIPIVRQELSHERVLLIRVRRRRPPPRRVYPTFSYSSRTEARRTTTTPTSSLSPRSFASRSPRSPRRPRPSPSSSLSSLFFFAFFSLVSSPLLRRRLALSRRLRARHHHHASPARHHRAPRPPSVATTTARVAALVIFIRIPPPPRALARPSRARATVVIALIVLVLVVVLVVEPEDVRALSRASPSLASLAVSRVASRGRP